MNTDVWITDGSFRLTLDFETRSACDLRKTNPWVYAEHPSTQVTCLALQVNDDDEPVLWLPDWSHDSIKTLDHELPIVSTQWVKNMVAYADTIEAHNAGFEQAIWTVMVRLYGFDPIPLKKWRCSAARAARQSLPRALGKLGDALNMKQIKDVEGHALMLKMCRPRKARKAEREADPVGWDDHYYWWEEPLDILNLCRYCMQDVRAEYALNAVLQELPDKEQQLWFLDQEINQRGVYCDQELVYTLDRLVEIHKEALTDRLMELTQGAVQTAKQVAKFREWMHMHHDVVTKSLDKAAVAQLLGRKDLPKPVREALQIRQQLGHSSVSKLVAMLRHTNQDSRVRGGYMYHGASTGRWSGKGVQLHNLPRGKFTDTDLAADMLLRMGWPTVSAMWGLSLNDTVSTLIRSCFCAPEGKVLIAGDFASIEGRVLAWIAGEEHVLQLYRDDEDPYKHAAASIYGVPAHQVTKAQRQVGKVAELALGYQGWVNAFKAMATGYGVHVCEEVAEDIARKWRKARPNTVALWRRAEKAVCDAIANPGQIFTAGRCHITVTADLQWLMIRLPSGRELFYNRPHIRTMEHYGRQKATPHYWGVSSMTKRWEPQRFHGGKVVENLVQAIGRDFQSDAMLRCTHPIVMHTHDEIVVEADPDASLDAFLKEMATPPSWGRDCPIEVDGWKGKRYRK